MKPISLQALCIMAGAVMLSAAAYFFLHGHGCPGYRYVNAAFACEGHVLDKSSYSAFRAELEDYIESAYASGAASEVAVYFRDLEGGPSFGINSFSTFAPASLLKLPVIFAIMDIAEGDPALLATRLAYSREAVSELSIPQQENFNFAGLGLKEGNDYTVEEMARAAIVYSDNLSYYTLVKFLNSAYPDGRERILLAFQELGVIDPRDPQEETVSVRAYAQLFRTLYNASYLTPAASEKVLGWLAEATFDEGLAAGLPRGVALADKFGERVSEDGSNQLHDCGVVYYPGNPYTLCVMTKGRSWAPLKKIIGEISALVYREVDSRRQ